jgi:capsular polysaccharide transport system permease protein
MNEKPSDKQPPSVAPTRAPLRAGAAAPANPSIAQNTSEPAAQDAAAAREGLTEPAADGATPPGSANKDEAAVSNDTPRLVVVPGQRGMGGPVPGKPQGPGNAAAHRPGMPVAGRGPGQRPVPPAARGAPVVVPAKAPAPPAKGRPVELQAWPELFAHDNFLTDQRRTRQRRFFGKLGLFVGLPTLLMALYVFLWATPRYVSEFEITYQTYQNTQSLSSGLVQTVLGGNPASFDFGSILYEYVRSETLLQKLDAKLNLRDYYSNDRIDYPGRLGSNPSAEKFLSYYRAHVVDVSEGMGGYLTIDVHAFDPDFAQKLATAIVQACDDMMDQMTSRARQDEMKFAEDEVARQEDRVQRAQLAQTKFQNEHGDINPTNTATQYGQIVASLEGQLAQTRTALTNAQTYAGPNSPQVTQLKNQISALEAQLQSQRDRLTGSGDKTYSQILEDYSRIQLEQQFAQNAYLSAQQGLAVARADAARKQSYLVDFVAPSHPDRPTRSFYVVYLASAFIGTLLMYAIGSLLAGAFRDQAGL